MTALLLALGLAGTAQAQDGPWWTRCNEYTALEGLPSGAIRDRALADNAQLFGVVETASADLFPLLDAGDDDDTRAAFEIGMRSLYGAEHVPASVQGVDCGPALAPVDIYTSSFGVGVRAGRVGAFYATSVQGGMTTMNPVVRGFGTWLGSSLGMLYAPVAPVVGAGGNDRFRWDWMAGVQARPGTLTARVGWIGSKGLYTNVDERFTRLFLRSAIRPFADEAREQSTAVALLPYVKGGVDRLPLPDDVRAAVGSTRLYGRKLAWYTRPAPPPPEVEDGDPREAVELNMTSGHIEQYDIRGLFDLRASWTLQPQSQLHEAIFAVHTPFYGTPEEAGDPGALVARVEVGATQVPAAWYYGVSPGMKPTLAVDAGWGNPHTGSFARVKARMNHADVLDVFPYAVGALSLHLEFGILAI